MRCFFCQIDVPAGIPSIWHPQSSTRSTGCSWKVPNGPWVPLGPRGGPRRTARPPQLRHRGRGTACDMLSAYYDYCDCGPPGSPEPEIPKNLENHRKFDFFKTFQKFNPCASGHPAAPWRRRDASGEAQGGPQDVAGCPGSGVKILKSFKILFFR